MIRHNDSPRVLARGLRILVTHTNENEYNAFVNNKKNEALKDRIILMMVTAPPSGVGGPVPVPVGQAV